MNSKKVDMTNFVYVSIMIIVFLLASCKTSGVTASSKYTKSSCCTIDTNCHIDNWNGLSIEKYNSNGGFNYLEDAIKVFKDNK